MTENPKINQATPKRPADSEGAHQATWLFDEMREQSGGLPDEPKDDPVRNDRPFKITHRGAHAKE